MASYHTSFSYKDKNSFYEGYVIVAFEPDSGFKDTFLSMENISDDYYDNTKRFDYGAKYSSQADVSITIIKKDGTDMSVKDFRECAKWLTGARTNSLLDMSVGESRKEYIGDGNTRQFQLIDENGRPFFGFILVRIDNIRTLEFEYDTQTGVLTLDNVPDNGANINIIMVSPIYSFLGKFTNLEQYKVDARTVGVRLTFSSLSPWAYSQPQTFNCDIGQALFIDANDILTKNISDVAVVNEEENIVPFGIDSDGVLTMNHLDTGSYFDIVEEDKDNNLVVIGIDTSYKTTVNNASDDLYTYINLDINFENKTCNHLSIYNKTLNEETIVDNMRNNEKVSISANQFITSDVPKKIFGDDFNFVWPRLQPGENNLVISGAGMGTAYFTYRYPMKIGDCTMDIDVNGNSIICDSCQDGKNNNQGEVFTGTISWDKITDTPTTIEGYGITNVYNMVEVDNKIENIDVYDMDINKEELDAMLDDVLK